MFMVGALPDTGDERPLIDFARLEAGTSEFRSAYDAAVPWRHLVVDDFLAPAVARRAARAFPPLDAVKSGLARWLEARSYDPRIEKADPIFAEIFEELFDTRFTAWLENVTGVGGLEADRRHVGAGLHQGGRGSYFTFARRPQHALHLGARRSARALGDACFGSLTRIPDVVVGA
jgi:hypothetical protein